MSWREHSKSDWSWRPSTACSMIKAAECPPFEKADREQMLKEVPDWSGMRILDLAGGIGRFTGEFAKKAKQVTLVEWIPKFVEESKRLHANFSNIEYICADAAEVDFSENSYDLIFASFLFMYLTDEEMKKVARRIEKWLVPGGYIFIRESCEAVREGPTEKNPTIYRTLREYDELFPKFHLRKEGSIQAWIDYLSRPLICYWLFEKPSNFVINEAISGIPVRDSTKTPPLSK
jgi:phosphoethanolamine N-methyltransferase